MSHSHPDSQNSAQGLPVPQFGTRWKDIRVSGRVYEISHLAPFLIVHECASIQVSFGHHVFTDSAGAGPRFRWGNEQRFLSSERIERSRGLPLFLQRTYFAEHSRACRSWENGEQFFMRHDGDWCIFYTLRVHDAEARLLKMRVVTAYTLFEVSQLGIPTSGTHQLYANEVIVQRLLDGEPINYDGRRGRAPGAPRR